MKFHLVLVLTAVVAIPVYAQEKSGYQSHIKPVLRERCYACHGALKQEGGLRLDTAALALKGGDSGAAVKAGDVSGSLLLQRVTAATESERMPPEGEPLKPVEIDALKSWIRDGAVAPADERAEQAPGDHWAFRPPVRPPVPMTADAPAITNPIDAFIGQEQRRRQIDPQQLADKRVWLRRVTIDLIGLPPSLAELESFLADNSPEAHQRVVDRLLESPQYGERWGRHWMDIWRYSDWWGLGAEVRNSQKHIWHWRDWIIESLNADKGYDQMLREMLAADELYPNDLDKLRASGFLARQYFKFNRTSWLDETVEHTSKAMLGLTFNCAKCHDHKYDPLSQREYYQLRAIFEPYQVRTDALPGQIDFESGGLPRAFDCNLDAQTFIHIRGDDRNPDKSQLIAPGIPSILSFNKWQIEPVSLPVEAVNPGTRPFVEEAYLKAAERRIAEAVTAQTSAQKKLEEAVEAARLVAENPAANLPADALSVIQQQLLSDNFGAAREDMWEQRSGKWAYSDARLKQSEASTNRAVLRMKAQPPADFEARLTYIATGGNQWKSIGIAFDVTDQNNEVLAYASAYAGGPKAQIAYKRHENYVYPTEAAQSRSIKLNQQHELWLRVRGTLVNLYVDGQLSVVYRLPVPRQTGFLEIIAFDATADFLGFELKHLPVGIDLVRPETERDNPKTSLPIDQAKATVLLAESSLKTARLNAASIRARAAAERARWQQPASSELPRLVVDAVLTERKAAMAKAEEDVHQAELDLLRATTDKKADAEKKRADALMKRDNARKAAEHPEGSYSPLQGSLKTLESNTETEDSRRKPFPPTSTGRRSAFAHWLTDARNPLAARVAVNHIWSRHFGRPLVPTVFDFGRKGQAPSHPELLDWLAVELRDSGWSMKRIHRLIVTSNTYRLSSSSAGASSRTIEVDPDNRYYWRANPIRMEAQVIRDSLLSLAGQLDLTRGGPPIPIASESKRRSLYFVHSHNEHQKFLSTFDDASVLECYRRAESIVPQQALALENSSLATTMAGAIEKRISTDNPQMSDHEFVRLAFLTTLSIEPTEQERALVMESFDKLKKVASLKSPSSATVAARVGIVHALLNHNDFITVR